MVRSQSLMCQNHGQCPFGVSLSVFQIPCSFWLTAKGFPAKDKTGSMQHKFKISPRSMLHTVQPCRLGSPHGTPVVLAGGAIKNRLAFMQETGLESMASPLYIITSRASCGEAESWSVSEINGEKLVKTF